MELRMIIYEDNCYAIRNWSKYQSADKLEEIRKIIESDKENFVKKQNGK